MTILMPTPEEIADENRRMRRLRTIVDLTAAILAQGEHSAAEALALVEAAKRSVLQLFPDKEATFELIYRPRFERIIRERLRSN